jgi:hypothetical protein
MFIDSYWEQFEPVSDIWFHVVAFIYLFIGLASFVVNIFQLYFLIRFIFLTQSARKKF